MEENISNSKKRQPTVSDDIAAEKDLKARTRALLARWADRANEIQPTEMPEEPKYLPEQLMQFMFDKYHRHLPKGFRAHRKMRAKMANASRRGKRYTHLAGERPNPAPAIPVKPRKIEVPPIIPIVVPTIAPYDVPSPPKVPAVPAVPKSPK